MKKQEQKLHILVIPNLIPFPPNDGGKLCIFGLLDYLRKLHHIQLLLSANDLQEKAIIEKLILEWPDVTIYCVELYQQEKLSAEDKIIKWLKNAVKSPYYLLKGILNKNMPGNHDGYDIHKTTPFYQHPYIFIKKLVEIINKNKFDIIQTEQTRMLNLVNVFPDTAKKVFVQIESRSNVLYDYGLLQHINPGYVQHVSGNTAFLEYAYMKQYDAVLALNENDKIDIEQNIGANTKVYTSPFGILDADIKELNIERYMPENLIFMGGEIHYPNVDALDWFLSDILVRFNPRPFKTIYITGKWSEKTIKRYQKIADYINFIGFVDDLTPYLKNSVSIVPVRIGGGGIRTKILSSMAKGSPVVATSLSAVGIIGDHQKELLISDTAAGFVKAINAIFNDNKLAGDIIKNAHELIVREYSQSKVGEIRNGIYREIQQTGYVGPLN